MSEQVGVYLNNSFFRGVGDLSELIPSPLTLPSYDSRWKPAYASEINQYFYIRNWSIWKYDPLTDIEVQHIPSISATVSNNCVANTGTITNLWVSPNGRILFISPGGQVFVDGVLGAAHPASVCNNAAAGVSNWGVVFDRRSNATNVPSRFFLYRASTNTWHVLNTHQTPSGFWAYANGFLFKNNYVIGWSTGNSEGADFVRAINLNTITNTWTATAYTHIKFCSIVGDTVHVGYGSASPYQVVVLDLATGQVVSGPTPFTNLTSQTANSPFYARAFCANGNFYAEGVIASNNRTCATSLLVYDSKAKIFTTRPLGSLSLIFPPFSLTGKVLGVNGAPLQTRVSAYDPATGAHLFTTTSDPATGEYVLPIHHGITEVTRVIYSQAANRNDIIDRIVLS